MKAILRKGMAACAAVLMGANVMAQSFDFIGEFEGYYPSAINHLLMKDGNPRLIVTEKTLGGSLKYNYYYLLDKLTILDNSLSSEKEFTSGPLFEEFENVVVVSDTTGVISCDSVKGSIYYMTDIPYMDIIVESECNAVITQSLFNDDEKYEFLLPELAIFESTEKNWNGTVSTTYMHKTIGFKIVSEDGTVLHSLILNEEKNPNMRCDAYVTSLGDKKYLIVESYISGAENEHVLFYEIKKDGSGIQKVREMRGGMNIRPTVANRDEQITITLNEENSNVARELVVTGVNGQLVGRRDIPAGENSVQIPASMLRSGMYNFTLQQKGQVVDNGKVIVK